MGYWRIKAPGARALPLVMYPELATQGMTIEFYSPRFNRLIELEGFDGFKRCPAKHWWPYCLYCRKFLFPADDHRMSAKHQRTLAKFMEFGGHLPTLHRYCLTERC